jgi:hypothetical protein
VEREEGEGSGDGARWGGGKWGDEMAGKILRWRGQGGEQANPS